MRELERKYFERKAEVPSGRKQEADVPVVRSGLVSGGGGMSTNPAENP